jgi:geranylgeranylglycerol-phosphate geranylgeranyltransferase
MNSENFNGYVRLSRPVNVLITLVSIPVACWIAGGTAGDWFLILLAALAGALVTAGANAINDAFDIEIDRINRPNRPLPRGILKQRDARRMWLVMSIPAIGINIFINLFALLIVLFAVVLLYYYSARLKKTILAGNFVVGLMTGMTFIYGGAVIGSIDRAIIPALFAFLVNLARELVKDVEDIEGDRMKDAVTLPVRYGVKLSLGLSTALLLLLIGTTIAAASSAVYHKPFLYIVLIADLLMIVSIVMMWQNYSPVNLRRVSTTLKVCMVIGLLSVIAGSV